MPLWEGAVPCVHCGHCCKVRACGFGKWDREKERCAFLVKKDDGTYDCGKFEEIINGKDRSWRVAPAFGAGCCSTWNSDRQALLRRQARR